MLKLLKEKNPDIPMYRVTDKAFLEYGRVLDAPNIEELTGKAGQIDQPECGSSYTVSVPELMKCAAAEWLRDEIFGEMEIQIGYCHGYNNQMNALEWHKSSEINIAVMPFVLLLGSQQHMKNGTYDSSLTKGFFVEPGQCVEVYATTLHYCPCQAEKSGFGCIVVLPEGTNLPLEKPTADPLLFRKNKWVIAHEQNSGLISRGAKPGIYGKNLVIAEAR
jgi:hypothetical protein